MKVKKNGWMWCSKAKKFWISVYFLNESIQDMLGVKAVENGKMTLRDSFIITHFRYTSRFYTKNK